MCRHTKHWFEAQSTNIAEEGLKPDVYRSAEWYGQTSDGKVEFCND